MMPIGPAKPAALVFLVLAALASPAPARLGESPEECDARYGDPVGQIGSPVPDGDAEARVYRKNGFDITVAFRDGVAWWVRYAKQDLNQDQRTFLFKANGESEEWRGPLEFIERRFWITASRAFHAVEYYYKGNRMLELLTDDCLKAHARALDQRMKLVGLDKAAEIVEEVQPDAAEGEPRVPSGVDGL